MKVYRQNVNNSQVVSPYKNRVLQNANLTLLIVHIKMNKWALIVQSIVGVLSKIINANQKLVINVVKSLVKIMESLIVSYLLNVLTLMVLI